MNAIPTVCIWLGPPKGQTTAKRRGAREAADSMPTGAPRGKTMAGRRPEIGVGALSAQPAAPSMVGGKGLEKAVRVQTRSRLRTSSGAAGIRRIFKLGPLGRDHTASKEVGSKMAEGAGSAGCQSQGQATTEDRRLTAPSSISVLRASGLGRLRACECARVCA